MGLASRPAHAESPLELQRAADAALYRAKMEGRGRACIYVESKMVLKSNYYPKSQLERLSKLAAAVRESATGPFDVVIECIGQPETWQAAVGLVRKGGRVNLFGGCPSGTTVNFDTTLLHYSALTLLASFHHTPRTIRRALQHIESGTVRAADFVDGLNGLSELPALFRAMATGNRAVKTLINVKG